MFKRIFTHSNLHNIAKSKYIYIASFHKNTHANMNIKHDYYNELDCSQEIYYTVNGIKNGPYIKFNTLTGKIIKKCNYIDGQLNGPCHIYDILGNIIMRYDYDNNELVYKTIKLH
jgi:antitoxin component YwqK of YwqJK toxin-antitoxin module